MVPLLTEIKVVNVIMNPRSYAYLGTYYAFFVLMVNYELSVREKATYVTTLTEICSI